MQNYENLKHEPTIWFCIKQKININNYDYDNYCIQIKWMNEKW